MIKAPLIILSGPAGSGKTTVAARVLAEAGRPLRRAVTATTRPPRVGEVNGIDYRFLDPARFEAMVEAGEFLEHARVHGNWYGTPRAEVEPYREQGVGVILVIDVQGAAQVRQSCPDHLSIFLYTSSPQLIERRLRDRGADSEAAILRRLETAKGELTRAAEYQYRVLNDDLDAAVRDVIQIIRDRFSEGEHA
ncbi:MAG: guanylate kinase [Gemmataceae bacterium]